MAEVSLDLEGFLEVIDNFDRPGDAYTEATYARSGTYAERGENKPGKRVPKAGAYAEAGVGRAGAEYRVFEAEARGPNASAGASASLLGASASARAELAGASAAAGPVKVKVGLGADAGVSVDANGLLDVIDNFDRPGDAYTEDTYARSGTYADGLENKTGKRVPKAGAYAEAGVGRARAEFSVFEAEARGPNASAGAGANPLGASAFARAELAGASAAAGPVKVKVGLGVDTGVSVGAHGLEAKVLGTGFTIGERPSVSILGNELQCCVL
ncbi:uncharacterized protein LOC129377106 [Poeciliopsis prolifica]|uniref:uncharacterized protein LOC129377106 n=1 Tax=Poeciliopsis prolifica TaxID=188132 RepID=UPI0024142D5E|nr:uncharacterized protein LOC129377106 [Poeciliopsis prolifica]